MPNFRNFLPLALTLSKESFIISTNSNFLRVTEYQLKDLVGKALCDFLYNRECEAAIKDLLFEAKKGKKEIETVLRKKDGSPLFFKGLLKKAQSKDLFLLFGWDFTFYKIYETVAKLVREIKSLIIKSSTKEELLERVCKAFVEVGGLSFVWIGVPDSETNTLKPLFKYGKEEGFLQSISFSLDTSTEEGQNIFAYAVKEKRSFFTSDVRKTLYPTFKEEELKRGYLSTASIPIYVNEILAAVINLYAPYYNFFILETENLFQEIKEDLELALAYFEKEDFYKLLSLTLENSDLLVVITDETGKIRFTNSQAFSYFGALEEKLKGKNLFEILEIEETLIKRIKDLSDGEGTSLILPLRNPSGEIFYLQTHLFSLKASQTSKNLIFLAKDISLQVHLIEMIENLKTFDPLTDTLYLNQFFQEVKKFLTSFNGIALVIVLDLYQFTYINDLYGFKVGDSILKILGERLKNLLKDKGFIARVSADEFCLFTTSLTILLDLETLFSSPFDLDGERIILKYNLGISFYPNDGEDPEELYRKANIACGLAKKEGPNVIKYFSKNIGDLLSQTIEIERLIETALALNQFQFFYQPYFDTKNRLAGCEALIRIVRPDGEIIPPLVFISQLEKSIYRDDFEVWAVKTIVEKINKFKIPIGLNLYPETFENRDFWEKVLPYLEKLEFPLILEITERGIIRNPETILKNLSFLKEFSPLLKIALDDFGTGYSNLSYIKHFPIDYLKIDLIFVKHIIDEDKSRGIVKTIIDLAHILGAKALAEGVETKEHLEILEIMGCDYFQGFYFERPISEKDFLTKYLPMEDFYE